MTLRKDFSELPESDVLTKPRSEQKRGHEAQLLILFRKLVEQMGNTHEGIASLEEAGQFATRVQFFLKLILQKSLLFLMSETLSA